MTAHTPDPHDPSPAAVHRVESTGAPATGSTDPSETELAPEEEPTTTGTLFLMMIMLMIIGGIWVIVYQRLITE